MRPTPSRIIIHPQPNSPLSLVPLDPKVADGRIDASRLLTCLSGLMRRKLRRIIFRRTEPPRLSPELCWNLGDEPDQAAV
ncbi:hypothetical protein [Magnetospirillum molischianum]|uniref:hypothetical protein n=1 Tax=Magnetospirillum molischianum TaxID=1083 RepID=UPI00058C5051|nr:hypothetical protein [Magnetospirillum molischianum]